MDTHWTSAVRAEPFLVLPDGCLDVISQHGRLRVVGPMTRAIWVTPTAPSEGLRFRPGAVRSWLGLSPLELVDEVVDADAVPALRGLKTFAELRPLLGDALERSPVRRAVSMLRQRPATPVRDLAKSVGLGERHLRRQFAIEVGLSPKHFARHQRLQTLARTLHRPGALATHALGAGYADQAHMSREVKALCGVAPTELRRVLTKSRR